MVLSAVMLINTSQSAPTTPTGWTITTDGLYKVHTFSTSGTFSYAYPLPVEYLIVWWGGWGAWSIAWWGGGGWVLTNLWWAKDTVSWNKTVTVWLWWAGGANDVATWYGKQWGNSSFNSHTAIWWGGGMCRGIGTAFNGYGPEKDGWCGWGWSDKWVNYPAADNIAWWTGTVSQWNAWWASGWWGWSSGGGGWAGWAGWTGNTPYNGQWGWAWNGWDWVASSISWASVYYGWGGWGWMYNGNNPSEWWNGWGWVWWTSPFPTVVRTDGTDWLGWGWGGGWNGETGWDGGNGVVIIRYLISDLT